MEYNIEKITSNISHKKIIKRIIKYIILAILMILFIINIILSFEENTHIFGIHIFNIISESMEPTLEKNDIVIVQKCKESQLHKGDIITFLQDEKIISHRILNIVKENGITKYETKGDNNKIADSNKVEFEQIYGKVVFKIKNIGQIVNYIQNIRGFINIIILAIIIYIFVSLRDKQKNNRKIKRKKYEIKKRRDNYYL